MSDKAGLTELATALHNHGVELLSTGGTAKAIRNAGLPCKDVSVLQLTLYDATGQSSNAMYFPLV